jgi:hypothetical protein
MFGPSLKKQRQLASRIASTATATEKVVLRNWIETLFSIVESNLSPAQKAKQAIFVTADSSAIQSVLKLIANEFKRVAWDDRSIRARFGIVGAAIGLAAFGGQKAGIAAKGVAIGVPLWLVCGAGSTFLGLLYEEITGVMPNPKTTYRVIDAERIGNS